jgi:hypothetical protein
VAGPRRCSRSAMVPWGSGPRSAEVFPETREQRCWWHKIGDVLNALPKSAQPSAKKALAEIWNAEVKDHAQAAANVFAADYGTKRPKAAAKITDDPDVVLTFYDYPAKSLDPPAHHQPDRFHLRHRQASPASHQRPRPAPTVSRWRSSSSNQHRPGGGPSTHPTSSRWSVPARYPRTASSSNDQTDQRVV